MKPIRTVFRIWYDELTDLFRDKGILIFILFVPLAYPLLYSWVYTNEVVREVPAAVVDDSRTPQSRAFIRMVDATPDVARRGALHDRSPRPKSCCAAARSSASSAFPRASRRTSGAATRLSSAYTAT